MHALHPRAVDIDLEKRPRQRQQIDLAAGELDREIGLRLARRRCLVIIGAHAILRMRVRKLRRMRSSSRLLDRVERVIDRLNLGYGRERGTGLRSGSKRVSNNCTRRRGDLRMAAQRVFHIGLAEGGAGLPQQFGVEPQDRHLPRRQPGGENEAVEPVILDPRRSRARRAPLQTRALIAGGDRGQQRDRRTAEIWIHTAAPSALSIRNGSSATTRSPRFSSIGSTSESATGSWPDRAAAPGSRARRRMERDLERRAAEHRLDPPQIRDRLGGVGACLIGDREGLQAAQPGTRLRLAECRRRRLLKPVGPAAPGFGEPLFERCGIDRRRPRRGSCGG